MTERGAALASLAGFAALVAACAVLLAAVAGITRPQIEANRERQLSATLAALTGRDVAAGDLVWRDDVAMLCDGTAVLRGASAGYAGEIRWLAAGQWPGPALTLRAVRIVAHQETPGIADFLDAPEAGWLATLPGLDAAALAAADTVSGATVTTRVLRRDLARALERAAAASETECGP